MFKSSRQSVMDPDHNALSGFPKVVRFQLMTVLALLWSAIFCANAGLFVWLPGYVLAHVILIFFGLFGTSLLFRVMRVNAPAPDRAITLSKGQNKSLKREL
jgi:hypothetical protein